MRELSALNNYFDGAYYFSRPRHQGIALLAAGAASQTKSVSPPSLWPGRELREYHYHTIRLCVGAALLLICHVFLAQPLWCYRFDKSNDLQGVMAHRQNRSELCVFVRAIILCRKKAETSPFLLWFLRLWPADYKSAALPAELHQRGNGFAPPFFLL